MKRRSFVIQLVALALAVLLPAESAHCAWMMSPIAKTSAGMRSDHACCRTAAALPSAPSAPQKTMPDCACLALPQAVAAVVSVAPAAPHAVQLDSVIEVLAVPSADPRLERGGEGTSPPRGSRPTGHLLRGPPAIA